MILCKRSSFLFEKHHWLVSSLFGAVDAIADEQAVAVGGSNTASWNYAPTPQLTLDSDVDLSSAFSFSLSGGKGMQQRACDWRNIRRPKSTLRCANSLTKSSEMVVPGGPSQKKVQFDLSRNECEVNTTPAFLTRHLIDF